MGSMRDGGQARSWSPAGGPGRRTSCNGPLLERWVSRDRALQTRVGKIKHMVTGATVRIESKFCERLGRRRNYMKRYLISDNEIMPWPIGENDADVVPVAERTLPPMRSKRIKVGVGQWVVSRRSTFICLQYPTGDLTSARGRRINPPGNGWLS